MFCCQFHPLIELKPISETLLVLCLKKMMDSTKLEPKTEFCPKNISGLILSNQDQNFRSQFIPSGSNFLGAEEVPTKNTSVRSAATSSSNALGQGHVHCNCTTKCKDTKKSRCKCRQLFRSCNSRCHNSQTCLNKE